MFRCTFTYLTVLIYAGPLKTHLQSIYFEAGALNLGDWIEGFVPNRHVLQQSLPIRHRQWQCNSLQEKMGNNKRQLETALTLSGCCLRLTGNGEEQPPSRRLITGDASDKRRLSSTQYLP